MGASNDRFIKYPRTPHLLGSRGTDDDKYLRQQESLDFIDEDFNPQTVPRHPDRT